MEAQPTPASVTPQGDASPKSVSVPGGAPVAPRAASPVAPVKPGVVRPQPPAGAASASPKPPSAPAAQPAAPVAPQPSKGATGPRYEWTKDISSQNAIKHGLRAKKALIPGESIEEFNEFSDMLTDDLAPADAMETELARRIIECAWKLRRGDRIEDSTTRLLHERNTALISAGQNAAEAAHAPSLALSEEQILADTMAQDFSQARVLERLQRYCINISNEMNKALDRLFTYRERKVRWALLQDKDGSMSQSD